MLTLLNNRYLLDQHLGAGGFSEVWRADDIFLQRKVVIKQAHSPDQQAHLLIEARHLATCCHPAIPLVYDLNFFENSDECFLVLQYVEGWTLDHVLPESLDVFLDVSIQLCQVLHYLHDLPVPIVHRDIKPANILVTPQMQVMLLDFGGAKVLYEHAHFEEVFYTSHYVAPEVWSEEMPSSVQSDIYSLGVTLSERLLNRSLNWMHGQADIRYPACPPLEQVLQTCCAPQPSSRPSSMAAVAGELRQIRKDLRKRREWD